MPYQNKSVGKFRPRLIELTSFKLKLLIRFIMNKVNKARYDDPGKPMKQISFTVKNLGGNLPKKQSTIVKRSFKSSTKPLSLGSTIPVDEFTIETFYCFRAIELFNIWMLFFLHGSQYVTNQWCMTLSTWLTHQLEEDFWLQSSSLNQQWRSRSTWLQNPKAQRCSSFFQRE